MDTAIVSLIAFFVVIGSAFTAITGVVDIGGNRAESVAIRNALLIEELESSFKLVSAVQKEAHKRIDLVVTNDGRRTLADFEDWIVTVRYDQDKAAPETYLVPFYSDTLVDNSWTVDSFWLEYTSQAELIEPERLNVYEEMEIRIMLNPKMEKDTWVVVSLTSPYGVTETITFKT